MNLRFLLLAALCTLGTVFSAIADTPLLAQKGFMKKQQGPAEEEFGPRQSIRPSGLVPSFPRDARCAAVASPFGSATRYDGSRRPLDRFGGVHGGMDLSLDEGTPLLAIASGRVVHFGIGGQAEGIYLWLQHAPEDTGLPFWIYSKYQHLSRVPEHALGDKVQVAQVVAISGRTGTAGPHYGPAGYPHLHLTTVASPGDKYERRGSRIVAESARMFDPVAMYFRGLNNLDEIDRLPEDRKPVPVPYVAANGSVQPSGSPVVWPVGCKSM